jgi:hypothetical protein
MVGKIYEIKNRIIEQIEEDMREKGGANRIDPQMVDMVKDLAEAEKSCMEAEYYSAVTEAMEREGYDGGMDYMDYGQGNRGRAGYSRMGYNPNRDSMGRYARRRGYHEDMEALRQSMGAASPEEREKMKRELREMLGM